MFLNLIKIPWLAIKKQDLTTNNLRKFGLSLSVIISSLFGIVFPWLWSPSYPFWPWLMSGVLIVISLLNANLIKPFYIVFMYIAYVIGTINISIMLSLVFYFFMLPVSIIFKIFGRDSMTRKLEQEENSYRILRNDFPKDRLERPF